MMERSASPPAVYESPGAPVVPWEACPIETALGTLGRKWTLTILRDIAFYPGASFTLILKNNPGLRQRTLSLRLKQLRTHGLVAKTPGENGRRRCTYRLTESGLQVWPVLATLAQFGVQNYPSRVFADGKPRELEDVWPAGLPVLLGRFASVPPRSSPARPTHSS